MKKINKKAVIAILASVVFFIAVFIFVSDIGEANDDNKNIIFDSNKYDLPNLVEIDPNENPILYDFVNSSISYKMDVNPEPWGIYYALLMNKNNPNVVYAEYYNFAEKMTFPTLGSEPVKIKLDKTTQSEIKNFSSKLSK